MPAARFKPLATLLPRDMSDRRDPFSEIEEMLDRLNRRMQGEFRGPLGDAGDLDVDVAEHDDEVVVTADVPGFERDDIEVRAQNRRLTIDAEHEEAEETEDEDANYYRRERRRRAASRTVDLPVDVDETAASASYEHGVLTVRLPKADLEDAGRRIDID